MRIAISITIILILILIIGAINRLTPSLVFKATVKNQTENTITCYVVNGSNNKCKSYEVSGNSDIFVRLCSADSYEQVDDTMFLFVAVDMNNRVIMAKELNFEENKVAYLIEIKDGGKGARFN